MFALTCQVPRSELFSSKTLRLVVSAWVSGGLDGTVAAAVQVWARAARLPTAPTPRAANSKSAGELRFVDSPCHLSVPPLAMAPPSLECLVLSGWGLVLCA